MHKYFITTVNELPEWFKIQHYAQVTKLDAVDWLSELHYRYKLRDYKQKGFYDAAIELFQRVQAYGLVTLTGYYRYANRIEDMTFPHN